MVMIPNLLLFYVKDPIASQKFYERIFGTKAKAAFPTYVAFSFENGMNFGLWSTAAKNFVSDGTGCRSELSFMVPDEITVKNLHDNWKSQGVKIEQDLQEAVFGLTFVALDPDGHRIRVCMPDKN